jgi:type VI secretion system secreted protein VgrG
MNDMPFIEDFIQASRVLKLSTPLGEDVLLPERASISEGVNQLFEIEIAVRSKKDIAPADLIGKCIDLELEISQGEFGEEPKRRCWNGLVTELHEGPAVTRGLRSYHLVVRPSLWLLSQTRDSRIWMDQTTIDVLATLLKEHGLNPAQSSVFKPATTHFSVQFNESDLRYLLRRFEQEGFFYWFTHEKGGHKLHVANYAFGWLKPEGDGKVRISHGSSDSNHINEWKRHFSYVPGKRSGADWDYKNFGYIPEGWVPSGVKLPGNEKREIFEWPSRALEDWREAEAVEKLRIQATEADHERVFGASNVRILEPGRRFQPYDAAADRYATIEEHVIIKAEHIIVDRSYETDGGSLPEYRNRFEAIPSRVPLTPHRTTPKPKIEGLQVAVVAGPEGEEIHCDSEGCVKLWFPWQRDRAKKDGSDTKWIRVSTNWAGQGWGGQVIPRIGMEVLVAFLDSDPDRPIVTGLVPNSRNKVPYALPENKTKTVFRTNTHKSKYGDQFNELSFEDEKGREEVYLHAQKDMSFHVENNHATRIDNNRAESVGNNNSNMTGNVYSHTVGGDMNIMVGATSFTESAIQNFIPFKNPIQALANGLKDIKTSYRGMGNYNLAVSNNKVETVSVSSTEVVGAAKAVSVAGAYEVNVGGNQTVSIGGSVWNEIGISYSMMVGKRFEIVCGKSRFLIQDGLIEIESETIRINGKDQIKLSSSKIDLN